MGGYRSVAGIAVVFAAGNSGPGTSTSVSPANYDNVLSVGAVDEHDNVMLASSRGPAPDGGIFPLVMAPGESIRTADLTFGGFLPDSMTYVSGTSFAEQYSNSPKPAERL